MSHDERPVAYVHADHARVYHSARVSGQPGVSPGDIGRALCGFRPEHGWAIAGSEPPGYMPGCSLCDDRRAGRVRRGPLTYAGRRRA